MRPPICAALAMATFAGPAFGQETLVWKFREGATFYLERQYHQKQTIDVKNKTFKQESSNTWTSKITVRKAGPDEAILEQTIVAVTYKRAGPAAPGSETSPEAAFAEKLKGCTLRITTTPAGRVRKFEGYDDLLKKVADKQEDQEKALRFLIPERALRDGLEEVLGFLPETAVKSGDGWQRNAVEPVPPFGSFRTRFLYTYAGRKDGIDTIDYTLETKYQLPEKDLPLFRVIKGELRADQGKGQVTFDAAAGRLIRGEKLLVIRGNLILEASGNQTNLEFVSENRLQWRLLDRLPK